MDYIGDGITGDGTTGDGITGDGITGDGITGDGTTGDGITGDIRFMAFMIHIFLMLGLFILEVTVISVQTEDRHMHWLMVTEINLTLILEIEAQVFQAAVLWV